MAMAHQHTARSDQPTSVHSRSGDIRLCQDEVHVCSSGHLKPADRLVGDGLQRRPRVPVQFLCRFRKIKPLPPSRVGGGFTANAFAADRFTDGARQCNGRQWQ